MYDTYAGFYMGVIGIMERKLKLLFRENKGLGLYGVI